MIKRLLAFLKSHLFEILLFIFCITTPYTLGRYVSLRGVLASFFIFSRFETHTLLGIFNSFLAHCHYLCVVYSDNNMVWSASSYYGRSFFLKLIIKKVKNFLKHYLSTPILFRC